MIRRPPRSTLLSLHDALPICHGGAEAPLRGAGTRRRRRRPRRRQDRKSTRLNSSHLVISYAVFCLKKKKNPLLFFTVEDLSRIMVCNMRNECIQCISVVYSDT